MKKILFLLTFLCSVSMFAQDVIVKKDGSTIVCRVIEFTESEIIYKKWSDLKGSNYVMDKSLASAINYENGKKVNISEMSNLYMPQNQNTGEQQFNDKTLLALDYQRNNSNLPQKAKKLRIAGCIGGVLAVAGGIVMLTAPSDEGYAEQMAVGGIITGCGAIGGAICLLKAHSYKKQYERLQTSAIYQQDFILPNNSTLHAGLDMISDRSRREKTLGLGLCYKF
ncbi:MAG: hypothetical protein IJB28_03105 [Bacteroidaceae bacterium]|nr:hypothetical protein [Bacteroidaceae bacterium]MBQ6800984.1 hypothetical protein [Bacteroidaceae bacterium]